MKGGPHDVKPLDEVPSKDQRGGHYCDKHKEQVKIYCSDCQINVCSMCCLESHKAHAFERIDVVVQEFARSIDDKIKQVTSRIDSFHGVAAQLVTESSSLLDSTQEAESEIRKRGDELKQSLIRSTDRQVSDLLDKLQTLRSTAEKEVKAQADAVQLALTELESFRTSSLELTSKGSPSDITQAKSDVCDRANELLQEHVIPGEYHAPKFNFTPMNTEELLRDDQNFIGHVVKVVVPGSINFYRRFMFALSFVQFYLRTRSLLLRTCTTSHVISGNVWLYSGLHVMKNIPTNDVGVLGVTSVDERLFMLLHQDVNQVAVYSINDYQLLRHLNLRGLKKHEFNDLTSCVLHRCLYMSDYNSRCIHRYDLASTARGAIRRLGNTTTKWTVASNPCGLSITPSCNPLVICKDPNKLVELSAESGQCVREIALQSDIRNPYHGVQLTTGQYVVCHSAGLSLHRVCMVDDDGRVTRSYGGQSGSDVGQLCQPCHLAVDEKSQFLYVADRENNRVVLLSPTLEFVRYISEGLSRSHKLYLHHATRRLYVGQSGGDVVAIQL